jgi:hypothetical protein
MKVEPNFLHYHDDMVLSFIYGLQAYPPYVAGPFGYQAMRVHMMDIQSS